jgi:hypothetical protein
MQNMHPNIENQAFFSRFAKGLPYLAIVVKNVKEKYGKDYRLKKDSGFVNCIYTTLGAFFTVSCFNVKENIS